jgi:P27 family predicted phage terminase small subunit
MVAIRDHPERLAVILMGGPGSGRRKAPGRGPGGELVPLTPGLDVPPRVPRAPRGLGTDARRLWRELWLNGPWVMPGIDNIAVEQVCRIYDDVVGFRDRVADDGRMITGSKGQPVAHPLIAETRKHLELLDDWAGQLGLRPDMRARLGLTVAKATALDELTARRRTRQPAAAAAAGGDVVDAVIVPDGDW